LIEFSLIGSGLSGGNYADHILAQCEYDSDDLIGQTADRDPTRFDIAARRKDHVFCGEDFDCIGEVYLVFLDIG